MASRTKQNSVTITEPNITTPNTTTTTAVVSRGVDWWWVVCWFFVLVFLGLMIWEIVVLVQYRGQVSAGDPDVSCTPGWVIHQGVAAEPYSGAPAQVLSAVTDVTTCQNTCASDNQCLFFTHDISNSSCYLYHNNTTMNDQNVSAAVMGPTHLQANVFVKNTGRVINMNGVFP